MVATGFLVLALAVGLPWAASASHVKEQGPKRRRQKAGAGRVADLPQGSQSEGGPGGNDAGEEYIREVLSLVQAARDMSLPDDVREEAEKKLSKEARRFAALPESRRLVLLDGAADVRALAAQEILSSVASAGAFDDEGFERIASMAVLAAGNLLERPTEFLVTSEVATVLYNNLNERLNRKARARLLEICQTRGDENALSALLESLDDGDAPASDLERAAINSVAKAWVHKTSVGEAQMSRAALSDVARATALDPLTRARAVSMLLRRLGDTSSGYVCSALGDVLDKDSALPAGTSDAIAEGLLKHDGCQNWIWKVVGGRGVSLDLQAKAAETLLEAQPAQAGNAYPVYRVLGRFVQDDRRLAALAAEACAGLVEQAGGEPDISLVDCLKVAVTLEGEPLEVTSAARRRAEEAIVALGRQAEEAVTSGAGAAARLREGAKRALQALGFLAGRMAGEVAEAMAGEAGEDTEECKSDPSVQAFRLLEALYADARASKSTREHVAAVMAGVYKELPWEAKGARARADKVAREDSVEERLVRIHERPGQLGQGARVSAKKPADEAAREESLEDRLARIHEQLSQQRRAAEASAERRAS